MADALNELLQALSFNLGGEAMAAIRDPEVVEIMANPDGALWVERLGREMAMVGTIAPANTRAIVQLMASGLKLEATAANPIVEGELPIDGSRFEGVLPPVVSQASFTIRKRAGRVFSLREYVEQGAMTGELRAIIEGAVLDRLNMLVVGGTGSGKTTLVNGIILAVSESCPSHRLLILEDTLELRSRSENTVFLRTSQFVNMTRLLKTTLRYRPDRIIICEVRDHAALDLLKAWNTGHPGGVATVHANSAAEGLERLEELVEEAGTGPKHGLIGRAVDLVLFIQRCPGGRRVTQALRVESYRPSERAYQTKEIYNHA